ncbi:O-antigen translocase [Pectobacterium punjabense]|uniref:O-antigen translocase n=1 Tax=Pectobacterium punjabense TaxID=2108399 RepID=UPI001F08049B|nr:O-antigen translocase [Pectobacterium punjabense]
MNFAKVTILSGAITLLRLICGLLISKIIAIYTGPAGLANLGQLQNFVGFINGFISSQVSQGVNRYSSEYKDDYETVKDYWRAAVKLSAIACCFIIVIGCFFSLTISKYLFGHEALYWLIILALSVVPLNVANSIFLGVLNGFAEHNRYFIASFFSIISSLISMATLVFFWGIEGALISAALNNAIAGLWLIIIIYRRPWFTWRLWFGHVPNNKLSDMKKYFLMGIIGALTGPISTIAVRTILVDNYSLDYAGCWQAVTKVSEAYLSVLTTAMTVYYFPKTAAARTVKEHLSVLESGAKIVVPLSLLMAISIFSFKDYIINILFSKDFYQARHLFLFQNIGDFFRITSWLFATILLAKGYFKINIFLEIIFSLLYPILTKLFIVYWPSVGVSIAYCITYVFYFVFSLKIYLYHIRKLKGFCDES